jgi:hypothetical protein
MYSHLGPGDPAERYRPSHHVDAVPCSRGPVIATAGPPAVPRRRGEL